MPIVHETRAEFVRQTLEKYGFGKGQIAAKPIVKKHDYEKPEKSIYEIASERFKDQARDLIAAQQGRAEG